MRRTLLTIVALCAIGCAAARHAGEVHFVTFNDSGRPAEISIRLDGKLVYFGTAAVVTDVAPTISFDVSTTLGAGLHHVAVSYGGQTKEVEFQDASFVTVETRLDANGLTIDIAPFRRLYL
jgi:hypothetical protein